MTDASTPSDALVQPAPPEISESDAVGIAREVFGVSAAARALGSHQDRNFLLTTADGPLLLKIANPATPAAQLEEQSRAAEHIAGHSPQVRVPRSVRASDGNSVRTLSHDGAALHARLLDFVAGETLSGGGHLSPASVRALGALAAEVDLALASFESAGHPHQWDLRRAPEVLRTLLPHVADDVQRALLQRTADACAALVATVAADLPVQTIHGDLTDDNVVTSDPLTRVPDGIIDLGDLGPSWTVAELAITVSSLLHHDGVDIPAALEAVRAFHARRPLSRAEAVALWPLVALRGAVLVASAHHVLATDPGNDYAAGNLVGEQAVFDAATSLPLPVATALVLAATGHEVSRLPLPDHGPLLPGIPAHSVRVLDLSPTSPALAAGRWLDPTVEDRISHEVIAGGASATVTRFGEPQLTRARPRAPHPVGVVRLGLDVRVGEPAEVHAPWDGELHRTDRGVELRAHGLSLVVDGVAPAADGGSATVQTVTRGAVIARADAGFAVQVRRSDVPTPEAVTTELFPGWCAVVADPSPLLSTAGPFEPVDGVGLLARREAVLAEVQEHYYADPPVMVRGWREHLVDADGRVYLDMLNNVTAIGHGHPRLSAAAAGQWELLNTNSRFHYPAIVAYAERLAALLPAPLDTVFLVNSGSEAVDLALRLARAATGRRDVLAVREAYHGWTDLSDAVSTSIADNPAALQTRPEWVHTVDAPNSFRGTYRGAESSKYAVDAVSEIDRLAAAGTPLGAFIAEPWFGNAGGIALPEGYLTAVYDAVRRHGGLAIADEVQVGFGRLGDWFWGFQQQGVVPDVVTIAKAIGNGHPLGAVITTRAVADAYRTQGYFFSSAGGSPVSSVVGLTVLDVLEEEQLQRNAREVGGYLRDRLAALGVRHPLVGTVHGSGFYLGLEFVRDRDSLEPATVETAAICDRLRRLGVIVQPTGDHLNVLKIKPPMCLDRASADAFVAALDHVLTTGY